MDVLGDGRCITWQVEVIWKSHVLFGLSILVLKLDGFGFYRVG